MSVKFDCCCTSVKFDCCIKNDASCCTSHSDRGNVVLQELCESIYASYLSSFVTDSSVQFKHGKEKIYGLSPSEVLLLSSKMGFPIVWNDSLRRQALAMVYRYTFDSIMISDEWMQELHGDDYSDCHPRLSTKEKVERCRWIRTGQCSPDILLKVQKELEIKKEDSLQKCVRKENWMSRVNQLSDEEVVDFYDTKVRVNQLSYPGETGYWKDDDGIFRSKFIEECAFLWQCDNVDMCRSLLKHLYQGEVAYYGYNERLTEYQMERAIAKGAVTVRSASK